MDPSEVDIKALQDRNRRLESSLLMTMGIIKSLHSSLRSSLQINRSLEISLAVSQQALEQVLQTSSLEPAEATAILSLIQESKRGLPDENDPAISLNAILNPEFASVDDFSAH